MWSLLQILPIPLVLVVQPGQPRGEALHRGLELRVEVDEDLQLVRQPSQRDLLFAATGLEFFEASVGEVHAYWNAASTRARCSRSWACADPVAGAELAGRVKGVIG